MLRRRVQDYRAVGYPIVFTDWLKTSSRTTVLVPDGRNHRTSSHQPPSSVCLAHMLPTEMSLIQIRSLPLSPLCVSAVYFSFTF